MDMANEMLSQYERDGVFIPRNLRKNIFTIIAKDNIDHNARSSTATKHYHGTSFSVFQFSTFECPGEKISQTDQHPSITKSQLKKSLPVSYIEVRKFLSPPKSFKFIGAPNPVKLDSINSIHDDIM